MFDRLFTSKFSFWVTYMFSRMLNWLVNLTGKYNDKPKQAFSIFEARAELRKLTYSSDILGIKPLAVKTNWMRTAEYVQTMLNKNEAPQTDCDEYAIYACSMLSTTYNVFSPRIMTIRWKSDNILMGHNTCLFEYVDSNGMWKYGTLCNWGLNKGFFSPLEAARYFAESYNGKVLAFCLASSKLRLIEYAKDS